MEPFWRVLSRYNMIIPHMAVLCCAHPDSTIYKVNIQKVCTALLLRHSNGTELTFALHGGLQKWKFSLGHECKATS
jgi:hypothetical protein